jgi:tetratricopeptide (TPR) repeat protein
VHFQRALSIDPLNAEAQLELANTHELLGNVEEAESSFRRAIAVRPNYWASQNELGRFYFRLGRYAEAERQFRRVIDLTPDNARAYSNLGVTYYNQERYDEAAAMFEKSVALRPKETVYGNIGTIYFYQARYSDAARTFERAVEINDCSYASWRNLAAAYHWSDTERPKAAAAFERAAELAEKERRVNARRPTMLVHLADCYSMLGKRDLSRELLEQALVLAPQNVSIMFNAGVVYEQLGDRVHALEWIGKALRQGYSRNIVERSPSLSELRNDPAFQALSTSHP